MDVGDRSTHVGTETANQRGRSTFENHDVVVELSGDRGNFEANEASTDHDDPLAAFGNLLANTERIVKRSQHVDVLVAALLRQATMSATSRPKCSWTSSKSTSQSSMTSCKYAEARMRPISVSTRDKSGKSSKWSRA